MVPAGEFVSHEPLLAFVEEAGVGIASALAMQDQRDALADLLERNRRCPFFFPRRASVVKNQVAMSERI